MCGIFGCIADDAAMKVLDGLRKLEYRGYDSAGLDAVFPYVHEDLLKDFNFIKSFVGTTGKAILYYLDKSLSSYEELVAICEEEEASWQ